MRSIVKRPSGKDRFQYKKILTNRRTSHPVIVTGSERVYNILHTLSESNRGITAPNPDQHTQVGAWRQKDTFNESRSQEGVGGVLLTFGNLNRVSRRVKIHVLTKGE